MTLTDLFEPYFQWWQSATARYVELFAKQPSSLKGFGLSLERYLQSKRMIDRMMEETWRSLRLPSSEEITRILERLNNLESRLVALQKQNWSREGIAVAKTLESMNQVLKDLQKLMAHSSCMGEFSETIKQVARKPTTLTETCADPEAEKSSRQTALG